MSYITTHRGQLENRHYITTARAGTHWYNFYEGKLDEYRRQYGENFCLVINCSNANDDAYILPYSDVKDCFPREYLQAGRWVGTVVNENLRVSLDPLPMIELNIGDLHNAFDKLQDAPNPVPTRVSYDDE